jgi:metal-responsive CopG/Arc/MetJ family transcriptional regulator
MKTAVSVPDDVFERADRLARSTGRSRSDVYSAALREYVARHAPDEVTEALNLVVGALGPDSSADMFVRESAKRTLSGSDW